ncbi:aminotransferase-like domain-containing protein [Leeia oryzae]|uniref:aminotransferase-like domain-containing protein n=1 Tax=Leeia oryzae TaxID=356662 RepID=UPI00036512DA|nr:PLP-dependent aminotransferase family protein [Leeia oryzae]
MFQIDKTRSVSLAEQIVQQMEGRITAGKLAEGARLPSVRQLADKLGVSLFTIVTAYERLVAKGLVESRPGQGSFVARRSQNEASQPRIEVVVPTLMSAEGFAHHALETLQPRLPASSGFLPAEWFEGMINPTTIRRLLKPGAEGTMPAPVQGSHALREQLAIRLVQAGMAVTAGQILVTQGATHAFELIAQAVLHRGSTVLVEDPGYFVIRRQLEAAGLHCIALPRLTDGPDLEALDQLASQYKPSAMFTQTLLHNPTGGNTSLGRSHKLLSLAAKHDFWVVEDDVYGDLTDAGAVRLAQLDEFQRVFHVGSFTKVLNPGMRVGYVVPPLPWLPALQEQKMLSVLTGSSFDEALVADCLASGRFRKHVQQLRNRLGRARSRALAALEHIGLQVVSGGRDGMFLWVKLPDGQMSSHWAQAAQAEGILLASGTLFSMSGNGEQFIRLNAAYASDPVLLKFFQRLMG